MVKNSEIHYVNALGYLYSYVKIKHIELKICSWRLFKENLELSALILQFGYM